MGENGKERKRRVLAMIMSSFGLIFVHRARDFLRSLFHIRRTPIEPTKGDHVRALSAQMTEGQGQNEWPTPPHDPEHIRWKLVLIVAIVALSFYAIGTILAWFQLLIIQAGRSPSVPDKIGENRINMLIQPVFDLETASYEQHRRERLRLSSYGWVDRENQVIYIPVERAIEELLADYEKGDGQGASP